MTPYSTSTSINNQTGRYTTVYTNGQQLAVQNDEFGRAVLLAINRSRRLDEIVTIQADSKTAARRYLAALLDATLPAGEDRDHVDAGTVYECWGFDPEISEDDSTWRVHVAFPDEADED